MPKLRSRQRENLATENEASTSRVENSTEEKRRKEAEIRKRIELKQAKEEEHKRWWDHADLTFGERNEKNKKMAEFKSLIPEIRMKDPIPERKITAIQSARIPLITAFSTRAAESRDQRELSE